jgi:ankyrin repeat protein
VNDCNNDESLTPLHCAVLGGRLNSAVVQRLVSAGADCTAKYASTHLL